MIEDLDLTFFPYLNSAAYWQALPSDTNTHICFWLPVALANFEPTLDQVNRLIAAGWERLPEHYLSQVDLDVYHYWGQLADLHFMERPEHPGDPDVWARAEDIHRVRATRVALAFTTSTHLPETGAGKPLMISHPLPPPQFGEVALIDITREPDAPSWQRYHISELGQEGVDLWQRLGAALKEMAAPAQWWPYTHTLQACLNGQYTEFRDALQSRLRDAREAERDIWRKRLADLELDHEHAQAQLAMRERIDSDPAAWLAQWGEIRAMVQELATAYWKHHQAAIREPRGRSLPALTSATRVRLPSNNHWRSVTQSFGPGVQPSLWNIEDKKGPIELLTPNNGHIRLDGQDKYVNFALHTYVSQWLKPEGLKHLIGILDAYYLQTQGHDQKADARVSLRQLLLRMGKSESQADDSEEQTRLMHTILYLNHCAVTTDEKRMVEEGRRKSKKRVRSTATPVLVIERIEFEKDGKLRIPTDVEFHLGKDYYEMLFGPDAQYFTVPSAALLQYHAEREQVELMLGLYLCNHITISDGSYRAYLHTIMLQSGLRSDDDLTSGEKRLEDAQRVLLALERLECDGFHLRSPHADVDTALAAALALGKCRADQLAPATLARLRTQPYANIDQMEPAQLRETRRRALQRLMAARPGVGAKDIPITFKAGPLLREQAAKRAEQRQAAIARDERALAARVVKQAVKQVLPRVVDALQGDASGAQPGQKRRGRPRKMPG